MLRIVIPVVGLALAAPAPAAPYETPRIAVTVEGTGPDVLLVPGLTSSPDAWAATTPKLPGHRYHYVQVKGFAGTPAAGNAADAPLLPALADELARYVAQAKIRPAVVGHSMGGTVAMMLAARHPTAVSKLMVVDMVPYMGRLLVGPAATPQTVAAAAATGRTRMEGATADQWRGMLSAMIGAMVANDAKRPLAVSQALASDRALVARTFAELTTTDLGPDLPRIRVPVDVVYTTPAGGATDAQMDAFYKAAYAPLPGVTLARAPASAHFIMWDNPAWFEARLRAFLAR